MTASRRYDRTAQIYVGGANIYVGATAEPRASLSPFWHVERDVTDLSALLTAPLDGKAILGNFVGVSGGMSHDGIICARAARALSSVLR